MQPWGAGAVEQLKKQTVAHVDGGKGGRTETGFGAYLSMTPDQLAAKVDDMTEAEFKQFKKDATPEFKKKYPGIDW